MREILDLSKKNNVLSHVCLLINNLFSGSLEMSLSLLKISQQDRQISVAFISFVILWN